MMLNRQYQIGNGGAGHLPLASDVMAQGKQRRAATMIEEIGIRLRWAREILADGQTDMCRLLGGVNPTTWNRWERGTRYPDPVVLVKMCDLFGITMDYLYRGDLRGVREDVAFRLAAYHPELVDAMEPAAARRAKAAAPVA